MKLFTASIISLLTCIPSGFSLSSDEYASCSVRPGVHLIDFNGNRFSYKDSCDIVLVDVPDFSTPTIPGFNVHVRTRQLPDGWTGITNIGIRIGTDVLEIVDDATYYLNGVVNNHLPAGLGGKASISKVNDIIQIFLEDGQYVRIVAWADALGNEVLGGLSVTISASGRQFSASTGICGKWASTTTDTLGRDGLSVMSVATESDESAFGQEWQVHDDESQLFLYKPFLFPEYPESCLAHDPSLIASHSITQAEAELSCSAVLNVTLCGTDEVFNECVNDILATGETSFPNSPYYEEAECLYAGSRRLKAEREFIKEEKKETFEKERKWLWF